MRYIEGVPLPLLFRFPYIDVTTIRLQGSNLVFQHPLLMFAVVNAFSLARMYT
jgi:hypothetical protein